MKKMSGSSSVPSRPAALLLVTLLLFSCTGEENRNRDSAADIPEVSDFAQEWDTSVEELYEESEFGHSEYIGIMQYDEKLMNEWPHVTYRSDGFRPGMASEWIRVIYTPDREFIAAVLYWNVADEEPLAADLVGTEWIENEISGWTGTLRFSTEDPLYGFGIIEDRFTLLDEETDLFQEFFLEVEF